MKHRGTLLFLGAFAAALAFGWAGLPRVIYARRVQPVSFSHKVHAETAAAKCEDCHLLREDGSFSGLPGLAQCAGCHAAPMGSTAAEKQFIEQYVTPRREIEWAVYLRQPANVYFPHAAHLKLAGLKCETCHGDDGRRDIPRVYEQDRIGGYPRDVWRGMLMKNCIRCHREKGLEHSCLDCHK
jgi:menaquinone reductase, multiheme cytochrome c subunit